MFNRLRNQLRTYFPIPIFYILNLNSWRPEVLQEKGGKTGSTPIRPEVIAYLNENSPL